MSQEPAKKGGIIQRMTQMFRRSEPAAPAAPPEPAPPVETPQRKSQRMDAYKKLCEEEAAKEPADKPPPQKIKYRARDMND
jgi:hypothetical protein